MWYFVFVIVLSWHQSVAYPAGTKSPVRWRVKQTVIVDIPTLSKTKNLMRVVWKFGPELRDVAEWTTGEGFIRSTDQTFNPRISMSKNYSLIIRNAELTDTGSYTYIVERANNSYKLTDEELIIVEDKPSAPTQVKLTAKEPYNLLLEWKGSDNHNSKIQQYIVTIRTLEDSWDSSRRYYYTADDLKSDYAYSIPNLKPFTDYQARVSALNGVGESDSSLDTDVVKTMQGVPSSPPIIDWFAVKNTSVHLIWKPPPPNTIHGIMEGYVLSYVLKTSSRSEAVKLEMNYGVNTSMTYSLIGKDPVSDKFIEEYEIKGLLSYRVYNISVRVKNGYQVGPPATKTIRTLPGVPSEPTIYHVSDQTWHSFRVQWTEPVFPNGVIQGYKLYWTSKGTDTGWEGIDVDGTSPQMHAFVKNLEPKTYYRLAVAARTKQGYSANSSIYDAMTDIKGPSAPVILNITANATSRSIRVRWRRPEVFGERIDRYQIVYERVQSRVHMIIQGDLTEQDVIQADITNLSPNKWYKVSVFGEAKSMFHRGQYYPGQYSEKVEVFLRGLVKQNDETSNNTAVVAVSIVLCVLIIAILIAVAIVLRRYWRQYPQSTPLVKSTIVALGTYGPGTDQLCVSYTDNNVQHKPDESDGHGAIEVKDFPKHVAKLHQDSDMGFSQEYEELHASGRTDLTYAHSTDTENRDKNRYTNINAYDHSRVVLGPLGGDKKHSDYINGNFVDGYHKEKAYIGTQGPMPHTFSDFWQMIWEQNCTVIVMITNLVEKGKLKCDQYWPSEGNTTYGFIQVKLLTTDVKAHYTIRRFTVKNVRHKKHRGNERIVYQYHYTDWPDFGVPDYTLPVLRLVRESSAMNSETSGPIVVHCSAGVGRTGTYIVLDSMMRQIRDKGTVNVFGFLQHIRNQRNYLVQREIQYVFIHDALLEFVLNGGETEVIARDLSMYVLHINDTSETDELTPFQKQFQLITSYKPKEYDMAAALKPFNKAKNRQDAPLPVADTRVMLSAIPGVDGSDYLNASFLHGYNHKKEYIVAQHPLKEYMEDFWRMIWDQNSSTVVVLTEIKDPDYTKFWPVMEEHLDCYNFKVSQIEERQNLNSVTLDFLLESKQDDYELMTRIICSSYWPDGCENLSRAFELLVTVKNWYTDHRSGPIIVVDCMGGVTAATFCALSTLYDQLHHEGKIDVYEIGRMYYLERPGVFKNEEDLSFIYKAMESISKDIVEKESSVMNGYHAPGSPHNNHTPLLHNSLSHSHNLNNMSIQYRQRQGERPPRPETTI
ncbi:putative receptor-type tyrosine-protein phosphatase mosPTP-1 [Tubulanus polymorphus]|uniref:putative receptor-type tyrosine-protein phosphatase mosPTP-1 n=1 Tax=Tubulanus polymorphus TaxID=672921 RepID=UPI003DA621C0